jgi:hypothetical protein
MQRALKPFETSVGHNRGSREHLVTSEAVVRAAHSAESSFKSLEK